jgi:hypothetical protein
MRRLLIQYLPLYSFSSWNAPFGGIVLHISIITALTANAAVTSAIIAPAKLRPRLNDSHEINPQIMESADNNSKDFSKITPPL